MKVEITWEELCQVYISKEISKYKSLRECGRRTGIDPAILSKIRNGSYLPNYRTMKRLFPKLNIPEPILVVRMDISLPE